MARITRIDVSPGGGGYRLALSSAQHEIEELKARLSTLKEEEAAITQRMNLLGETIKALQPLCADEEGQASPVRLAEGCLHVLGDEPISVPEIKRKLEEDLLIHMSSYKNPLAVLHTTLNRMFVSGQVEKYGSGQKTRFRRSR